jgi:hypothetical protein
MAKKAAPSSDKPASPCAVVGCGKPKYLKSGTELCRDHFSAWVCSAEHTKLYQVTVHDPWDLTRCHNLFKRAMAAFCERRAISPEAAKPLDEAKPES